MPDSTVLLRRLRGGGYVRKMGVQASNASDTFEQLLEKYGGEGRVKFHYVIDRRDLAARLQQLKLSRIPRRSATIRLSHTPTA